VVTSNILKRETELKPSAKYAERSGIHRMNRTKIEWTDYSWNPITGCLHGCWYCYAKNLTQRFKKVFPYGFEPHFYPERLKQPYEVKKPSKIFVCSIADLFASWTLPEWREAVLDSMLWCPVKHQFQMLTKLPEGISKMVEWPDNFWFGVTVTQQSEVFKIDELLKVDARIHFASFEPLLGSISTCLEGLQWIIIGKLTGSKRVKLKKSWVLELIEEAQFRHIPVFMKTNLGFENPIQQFPEEGG